MPKLDSIVDLLRYTDAYGNTLSRWLIAVAVAAGVAAALRLANDLLGRRAGAVARKHPTPLLAALTDLLQRTKTWFLLILAAYGGSAVLALPDGAVGILRAVVVIALLVQAGLWGNALVGFLLADYARRRLETDPSTATTLAALGTLGRLAIWSILLLLVLANLGVDVTAMVAGLGIGGVALALAAQNILGDLFASASIVLDKPFVLGDFIVVGDEMGTVEHIGLKTTRLRSLSGEQLVLANNDLLKSRIRNYKRMTERRVAFTLGVTYQTPADKLASIPGMLQEAVQAQPQTRFDRAHFKQYGDSALVFETVYYVLSPDYKVYMDIQQAVNLAIFRRFAHEQIQFAYPTWTVYLQR
ncbi:MAG: mechanosensitive ion channel family protein [Thermoguttaceae bacterium]